MILKDNPLAASRSAALLLTLVFGFVSATGVPAESVPPQQQTDLSASQSKTLREILGAFRGRPASKRMPGIGVLLANAEPREEAAATQMLVKESGRNLYRVDMSTVVSKYIGETEKNLEQAFAAAQASHSILLFDEADALFGKRGEVKDSHDRYAHAEMDYLLQQIEKFDGLVIISIKRKADIDQAFLRRLRFVLEFKPPAKT